ncbi:plasma membrane localization protein [Apophysomyces ossiformis]|uniref:Plasma membrane localization protein n=1 Tax=Apophysomyces ossiformis TaxID=679940 RepID=A0A8H7EM12_9FUNG|nr:plasma membrane localization protein [Apophysomyces ossiformis]
MILDTRDIELIDQTCETFIVFCDYHDGSTLGVDADFTSDFETLIKKFADFCNYINTDDAVVLKMRYIGHRAMQACVTSLSLHAFNFKVQLGTILLPLVLRLFASKKHVNVMARSCMSIDIRRSATKNDDIDKNTVDCLAAQTLSMLFNRLNGGAIRIALTSLFGFMDTKEKWWPPDFVVSFLELVLDSLQPQYRYLLVYEVLQQLDSVPVSNDTKRACLISILDKLLNADAPLLGISILEVLNSLFTILIKTLQGREFQEERPDKEDIQGTCHFFIDQGLIHSIGGLASKTYYQNQLDDVTGYVIAKLRANTTLDEVDGLRLNDYRRVALKCLDSIITANEKWIQQEIKSGQTPSQDSTISLGTWTPALGLLTDKAEVRIDFARILNQYLKASSTPSNGIEQSQFPEHKLRQCSDFNFISNLHQTIIYWIKLEDLNVPDIIAVRAILCSLIQRLGVDGIVKTTSLVFELQDMVSRGDIKGVSCQRAIVAMVVDWFWQVGVQHNIERLTDYMTHITEERKMLNECSTIPFPSSFDIPVQKSYFEKLEPVNDKAVTKFVDRHRVVEIVSNDGKFRDEEDTHGLDLESKLYAEWGSDAYMNHKRMFRIKPARDMDEHKPRLMNLWPNMTMDELPNAKKQLIKVETLKEALATQVLVNESLEADEESTQNMSVNSLVKRSKVERKDMNTLLSQLNIEPKAQSNHTDDGNQPGDDDDSILFPDPDIEGTKLPQTQYKANVSSLVQVMLFCDLEPSFCTKVQTAFAAATVEFIKVVNIKNSLVLTSYYYRFCDNQCLNDTIAWAEPASQFTLPFQDGADLNYIYPQALAKQLVPYGHTSSWDDWDIVMAINHDYYLSEVNLNKAYENGWTGAGVPPGGKFWFQNDSTIRSGQVDLKYVFLHEILHGAGFVSSWADYFSHEASPFRQLLQDVMDLIELQLLTPSPLWYIKKQMGPIYMIGFQPTMIFDKFLMNVDSQDNRSSRQSLADLGFDMQNFCVESETENAYISNFVQLFNRYGKSIPARELWLSISRNQTLEFEFAPPAITNSSFNSNRYLKEKYTHMILATGSGAMNSRLEQGDLIFRPSLSNAHVDQLYAFTPDFLMTDHFRTGQTLEEIVKDAYEDQEVITYPVTLNGTVINQVYQSPIGPGILRMLDTMGYSTVLTNTNYSIDTKIDETIRAHPVCDNNNFRSMKAPSSVSNGITHFDSYLLIVSFLLSWLLFL